MGDLLMLFMDPQHSEIHGSTSRDRYVSADPSDDKFLQAVFYCKSGLYGKLR
ncbi:MAG: hypothetical protein LLG37_07970 [Spirochaetia bacterium]|nr:hypothetical protein [Spirochaetia bacterium]